MNELRKLPQIIHHCMTLGEIPTSYKASLSYAEQLTWFCHFLETQVIPVVNNNSQVVQELQTFITEYFDNLDVQEEINNKLEAMAESGELEEIITQYLQVNGVLAFNTLGDLQDATNIVEGSVCRTLGKTTYNDGYGALYKIRTITSGDTVDGENIVALNTSETLIAEKILNADITNLQDDIQELETNLETEIAKKESNIQNKKFIFLGDSYDAGQSHDAQITKWGEDLATKLGITNYYNLYSLGAGFVATGSGGRTFQNILEDNLSTITDHDEIDYIVVGGGYNDAGYSSTYSGMVSAIESFCSYCATNFPKAKILIACFGYNDNLSAAGITVRTNLYYYVLPAYKRNYTIANQPVYIKNSEYILHNSAYFSSDGIHPNQDGIDKIVSCLYEYFVNGSINISSQIYNDSKITIGGTQYNFTEMLIDDQKIYVKFQNFEFTFATPFTITASNNTPINLGTHNSKFIRGCLNGHSCLKNVKLLLRINNSGNYSNELISGDLIFNGEGNLLFLYQELSGGSWKSILNVDKITIENFTSGIIEPYFN